MAIETEPKPEPTAPSRIMVPDLIWAPVAVGGLVAAAGLFGLAVGQPWLFPSLGPTAFLQAESPELPSSTFRATVIGHAVGLASAFAAVYLFGLADAPSVMATGHLSPGRVGASVLAVALTMLGKVWLKASHPPAAATTLLVSLGGLKATASGAAEVAAGVLIVAALGEGLRRIRLEYLVNPERTA